MATLVAVDQAHSFVLNVRSAEAGAVNPRWVRCEVSVLGGAAAGTQRVSLTESDVEELIAGFTASPPVSLGFRGTDENLIVVLEPADRIGTFFFSTWIGEPYVLMTGWRFPVTAADVSAFGMALRREFGVMAS